MVSIDVPIEGFVHISPHLWFKSSRPKGGVNKHFQAKSATTSSHYISVRHTRFDKICSQHVDHQTVFVGGPVLSTPTTAEEPLDDVSRMVRQWLYQKF